MTSEMLTIFWIEPDVAVTATDEVTCVVPPPPPLPPPPHAAMLPSAKIAAVIRQVVRPMLRRLKPSRNNDESATVAGNNRSGPAFDASAPPVIVSAVVVTEPSKGCTVGGLKAHAAPFGKPLQVKFTVELKPFCGVTVRVKLPCPPEFIVSEAGVAPKLKSGAGRLITYVAEETELSR